MNKKKRIEKLKSNWSKPIDKFENFHFSEQVERNNFFFDYKLRSGPSTSGNAIKLLEIKGYPILVVNKATDLKELFLSKSKSY